MRTKAGQSDEADKTVAQALIADEVAGAVQLTVVHQEPVDRWFALFMKSFSLCSQPGREEPKPGVRCSPER